MCKPSTAAQDRQGWLHSLELGSVITFAILVLVFILGCTLPPAPSAGKPYSERHEACNPADSPAICVQVQKCFQSNVATVVCREAEHDAIEVSTPPFQPGANGAADALRY
jgi:hypothetical protein